MRRVLLDTSAYSALFRGHADIARVAREASEIAVTPIVLGELRAGFRGGRRHERNERGLAEFLASRRVVVLPIEEGTSARYGIIAADLKRAGTPIPTNDVWIAASAMEHGHEVVTTDGDFLLVRQIVTLHFLATV